MGRARRAIEALAALAPDRAIVRRCAETVEIGLGLAIGDVVVVKPNKRLPAATLLRDVMPGRLQVKKAL